MNHLKTGLAAAGIAILTACTGPNVHYDYDVRGDFAKYKSFDWYAAPKEAKAMASGVVNPLMDARVHRVVDATLAAKGFRKETAKDPDFLVLFYPSYQPYRSSGPRVGVGMGFGFGRFSMMGVGVGVPVGGGRAVPPVGNIVLEIKDFKTNQMVWRAEAEASLDSQATPEQADEDVREAVTKMLGKFPPLASK